MFASTRQDIKIDVVGTLLGQNLYQRLGLTTNRVSVGRLHSAYCARLNLLYSCRQELAEEELAQAESIIDAAYALLSDRVQRDKYDLELSGEPLVPAEIVQIGESSASSLLLDRYRLESQIADGQRCLIYYALDTRLGRQVIVKRVRPELADEGNHQRLFQKEAQLFAQFNASNLVKILDYDVSTCSLVTEKMSHDLTETIKFGPVNPIRVRDVLRDTLAGLAALHREGIAHGRVELQHLFADDDGGVKLAVTPGMTGSNTALRPSKDTRHLAPELLNESSFGRPNLAIDVYSLGFVALELLCGNKLASRVSATLDEPERLAHNWLVWHASSTDQLPSIAVLFPDLPDDLCSLLERMTRKQQHERFADARACLEAMSHHSAADQVRISTIPLGLSSESGVEIYGAPPHLHAVYDAPTGLSWSDIVKSPSLLFTPEGRGHLTKVSLATLMLIAGLFLFFQPESTSRQSAKVEEAADTIQTLEDFEQLLPSHEDAAETSFFAPVTEEKTLAEISPSPDQQSNPRVLLEVLPNGRVLQVDGQTAKSDLQREWLLSPGVHTARCWDTESDQEFEHTFAVPQGVGYAYIAITVPIVPPVQAQPLLPLDPYADVRGRSFHPSVSPFEIQGASDAERVAQQRYYLEAALRDIVQSPHNRRKQMPFSVAGTQVDPRAAFTLALWAFRAGDLDQAVVLCRESLRAAEHYRVPFVLPLRLLNHLQIDYGKGGLQAAMGEFRLTLSWLNQLESSRPSPAVSHAKDEFAWWSGLLVGYATEVPQGLTHQVLDTDSLEELVRRTSSAEQWKYYQIGKLFVVDRFESLQQSGTKLPYATSLSSYEKSDSSLPLVTHVYETEDSYEDETTIVARREPRGLPPVSAAAPQRFVSYRPLDIPSIAGEVLSTLTKTDRSGLVLR